MELTDKQLVELEELSGCFFSIANIALIMQLDGPALMGEVGGGHGPVHDAYYRGRLSSEAQVRKSILDLAKNGSSPAQNLAVKLIDESKLEDLM